MNTLPLAATAVNINELALLGVGVLIVVSILAITGQLILSYLGQRNLNDIHSLGIQAVIAQNQQTNLANELQQTNQTGEADPQDGPVKAVRVDQRGDTPDDGDQEGGRT